MSLSNEELLDLRKRVLGGYNPSIEEIAQALDAMRAKRGGVSEAQTKRASMPKGDIDLNSLFSK